MTFKLADRIKQTSTTAGDGILSLSGTPTSFRAFSDVMSSGDTTYYCIENGSNFEVGIGTYGVDGSGTLSRDTVFASSTGSKLELSGRSFVFITVPAERTAHLGSSGLLDIDLNYLSDVVISSPSSGQAIIYNGSGFVNTNLGTASFQDIGTSSGQIPVIGSGNKLSIDLIPNATGVVTSVAGRTGNVSLSASDVSDLGSMATQSSGNVSITGGSIAGIIDLSITDGGTGASSASGARTNLGLGTMATQNASAVSISGGTITGLPTPTVASQASPKSYVDTIAAGLRDYKDSCKAATTSNITLSGLQVIDGYTTLANDRILVKNQGTASQNGIYLSKLTSWTRTTDADASAEVTPGMYCYIEQGTENSGTSWVLATTGTITLGSTGLSFTKFYGPMLGLMKNENLDDLTDKETARANLGVAIGVDVASQNHTHSGVYYTTTESDALYQSKNLNLTAIAGLNSSTDTIAYFTGSGTSSLSSFTSAARDFNAAVSASAQRSVLQLGSAALSASGDFASSGHNHDSSYYTKAQINSGYQPLNTTLSSIASLTFSSGQYPYFIGTNQATTGNITLRGRNFLAASGQSDQISALGFGSAVLSNSGDFAQSTHTHDDRYYTETEIGVILSLYPSLAYISANFIPSGGLIAGNNITVVPTGSMYRISADLSSSGVTGPVSSTIGQITLFNDTSGDSVTGFTDSGLVLSNSGVATAISYPLTNSGLINSSVTINSTAVSLGGTITGIATIGSGLNQFASTTSAALAAVISDEVGSGNLVFSDSPTLVTPNLGTPSTLVGTNISGTGSGFTAGSVLNPGLTGHITTSGTVASLGSFTLSQLNVAISDTDLVNASGDVVGPLSSIDSQLVIFNGSTGKLIKAHTGTGIAVVSGGVISTVSAPTGSIVGTSDTQTLSGKTISGSNNTLSNIPNSALTNSGITINSTVVGLGESITGIATTASGLSQFASTTSSALAALISDEVGSGSLVFANTPTLITPVLGNATVSSINRVSVTQPADTGILSIANSGTLATSGAFSLTLVGSGNSVFNVPTSGTVATVSNAETFSNKRTIRRVTNTTSATGIIPDVSTTDQLNITALATDTTFMAPIVTPNDADDFIIRIKDNGTARALSWNAVYRAVGVTIPTTTVINKTLYVGMRYNISDSKFDILATAQE
jgi:hypothetical protein